MNTFKLGKKEPISKPALSFNNFIKLVPNSPLVDFAPNYLYPMDLNDEYGDCVVAEFDHARQVITGLLTGVQKNFTKDEIIDFYKTQNTNFPLEDNGMDIQTFLEYLQANKYIIGFAKIDHTDTDTLRSAIYMGLAIMTGVQLQAAQENTSEWNYVENSPIVGGHGIPVIGYNSGIIDIVTWGQLVAATDSFVSHQMDEAWFILLQEHIENPKFRTHWDLNAFAEAVREITEGKIVIPVTEAN